MSSMFLALEMGIRACLADGVKLENLTMDGILKYWNEEAFNRNAGRNFRDRIEFLGARGPVDPTSQGRLIAISSYRIDNRYRFTIWYFDGDIVSSRGSEDSMRALFSEAGLSLVDKGIWWQPGSAAARMGWILTRPFVWPIALVTAVLLGGNWLRRCRRNLLDPPRHRVKSL